MASRISELTKKIKTHYKELKKEYKKATKTYGFSLDGKTIVFMEAIRKQNKKLKESLFHYISHRGFRHFLSMPFIYIMILPALFLDFSLFIYQSFAFPLYRIPKVKRKDYIVYDRKFLDYLNLIQKVNCIYCTYVNGLFAYAVEIGARTERYWCPIKAAKHPKAPHSKYCDFADYGDAESFQKKFNEADIHKKKKKK